MIAQRAPWRTGPWRALRAIAHRASSRDRLFVSVLALLSFSYDSGGRTSYC
ncbi:MAG: hypothetical protein KME49_04825 [Brasilonema octagenarum HA4186-MV1]|uniref:hypothetical protein n=1 Tax=Brasilonema TaxID=383614 RepID=UPI00145EEAA4|nr:MULTISPECIES: hypothetical protein [Brasilonema]MBW4624838.1 hypothetical protein [Brasilonema octagenarum HA4186-MV1]